MAYRGRARTVTQAPVSIKLLDRDSFYGQAKAGETSDLGLWKSGNTEIDEKQLDGDDQIVPWTFSTETIDRDGDTIALAGWQLEHFRKAGLPILWAHQSAMPPIGKGLGVDVDEHGLGGPIQFMGPDVNEFAAMIFRIIRFGALKTGSVGFRPIKFELRDMAIGGMSFLEQELLEFSITPVPSNFEALRRASKSIDVRPMYDWTQITLDGGADITIPRSTIEGLYRTLKTELKAKPAKVASVEPKTTEKADKRAISWAAAHPDGTPVQDLDVAWDGPREVAAAEVDDLQVMTAWVAEVEGDEELTKGDFKLPHHVAEGTHASNWNGTVAAMGAVLGARGGVDIPEADRRGVYNHLARHYRVDFERDPPEFRDYDAAELKDLFPAGPEKPEPVHSLETDGLRWVARIADDVMQPLNAALLALREAIAAKTWADTDIEKILDAAAVLRGETDDDCDEFELVDYTPPDQGDDDDDDTIDIDCKTFEELEQQLVAGLTEAVEQSVHDNLTYPLTGQVD